MKLKIKVMVLTLINIGILMGFTYGLFSTAFNGYNNDETNDQMTRDFVTLEKMIDNEKENLNVVLWDWADWDDTYNFIATGNDEYRQSNLQEESLEVLKLNMIVMVNQSNDILGFKDFGLEASSSKELLEKLRQNNFFKGILTEDENVKTSLVQLDGKVYFVGAALITNSSHTAKSNGAMVFVRMVDGDLFNYVEEVTGLKMSLTEPPTTVPGPAVDVLKTQYNGETYLTASKLQRDINGENSINMTILKQEYNYDLFVNRFYGFILGFIMLVAVILLCDYFVLEQMVFRRLTKLNDFMNAVATEKDTSMKITIAGKDEFSQLAKSTNDMLGALDLAHNNISQMDERFRLIMEATNDGYLDYLVKSQEVYISQEWKKYIGYQGEDDHSLALDYVSKIYSECKNRLAAILENVINGTMDYFEEEYRVINASGKIIWVLHRGKVVQRDDDNRAIRIISTLSDISMRKTNEQEIIFLSYSDPLTMLKNRTYMKHQLEMLNKEKNADYFIIMWDINGLKLTNDTFGQKEGDRVLIALSTVLVNVCESTDIVSRWSGDGFVIIVKNKEQQYVSDLIEGILSEAEKLTSFHFKISIAVGYAKSSLDLLGTEGVMNLAEKRMHRSKLMDPSSSRSAAITSLARTLHEKSSETEEHTMRIKELSHILGKKLGLLQDKLDELALLSLLHDIGKIGIPEQILIKPGKLTNEEWEIIKTHAEIGYRIAKSTPELEHIAEQILSHHEKYDGSGYPNGRKGEEIPYLSRIINVVDSFDVMTHSRIYKKASNLSYAIDELKRCSGTQFDPVIAKQFIDMIEAGELTPTLEESDCCS